MPYQMRVFLLVLAVGHEFLLGVPVHSRPR